MVLKWIDMRWIASIALVILSYQGQAQTWNEFFKQKSTQKEYLLEQLAAMKLYAEYAKDGYDIASTGVNLIKDFRNGEFHLHNVFFTSLSLINPKISNMSEIKNIVHWEIAIQDGFKSLTSEMMREKDRAYVKEVRDQVLESCRSDLDQLLLVISEGTLEMRDAERLERILEIHQRMEGRFQFSRSFIRKVKTLKMNEDQEKRDIHVLRNVYENLKNRR